MPPYHSHSVHLKLFQCALICLKGSLVVVSANTRVSVVPARSTCTKRCIIYRYVWDRFNLSSFNSPYIFSIDLQKLKIDIFVITDRVYYLVGVIAITCITVRRAVYHPRQHIHIIIISTRHHKLQKWHSQSFTIT